MTLERTGRVGRLGSPLWRMTFEHSRNDVRYGTRCQLILEPYACPNPTRSAELNVWFEEERGRYHWICDSIDRKPTGIPTYSVDTIEIPNSRRTVCPKYGLEYVVIQALARNELHGESATSAAHNLFWMHFVDDDDGLTYLHKYAPKENANFYARQRLQHYLDHHGARTVSTELQQSLYDATSAIEDAMKPQPDDDLSRRENYNRELGERFCRRVAVDQNVRDAIAAVMLTNDPEEVRLVQVRRLVELNATRLDHVIAATVRATGENHALIGLRACQRLEAEPESDFFKAVDAHVMAHPDGRGLVTFLKPHCKPVKSLKPSQDETYD